MQEELKVFKDCTVKQFVEIFGAACDPKLPLFVNLYLLREVRRYLDAGTRESLKNAVPSVLAMNFFWYYL